MLQQCPLVGRSGTPEALLDLQLRGNRRGRATSYVDRVTCPSEEATQSPPEYPGGLGADDLAAEVDVQGHRRVGVAELVGHLARAEAGLVQTGGDGLAEGVRGDPRPGPPCT